MTQNNQNSREMCREVPTCRMAELGGPRKLGMISFVLHNAIPTRRVADLGHQEPLPLVFPSGHSPQSGKAL